MIPRNRALSQTKTSVVEIEKEVGPDVDFEVAPDQLALAMVPGIDSPALHRN